MPKYRMPHCLNLEFAISRLLRIYAEILHCDLFFCSGAEAYSKKFGNMVEKVRILSDIS